MRPLRLEMTGLRSFRATQSLDFTDLTLFAVIGDTGAGKSSILEAIVFALYNASTWDARGGGALMSLDADAMSVTFDFSVSGKRYQVKRVVFRNARPSEHALRCAEEPDYRFAGAQAVNNEIRRVVGLDYDTFKKTVVLPQGRFAALLEMGETERLQVLTDLLGLDDIDRLREKLEPVRQEAGGRRRDALAKRGELGADPAAEASRFEEEERGARRACAAMEVARDELGAKSAARVRLGERLVALELVAREAAALLALAGEVRGLAPEHVRLQAELESLAKRRGKSKRELAAANEELRGLAAGGRDVASLVGFAADVERLRDEGPALAEEAAGLATRECALREEELVLERARGTLGAQRKAADAARSALSEAEKRREESRERISQAREAWRAWARASAALGGARTQLEEAGAEQREAAKRFGALEGSLAAAEAVYAAARVAFEAEERAERAAALAHEVHAGEPCPVCRRKLPAGFEPPLAEDFAAAKRACQHAERERDRARQAVEQCRAALDAAERRRTGCEAAVATFARNGADAEKALHAAGLRSGAAGEDDALQPLIAHEAEVQADQRAARERSESEQLALAAAEAEVKTGTRAHTGAQATHVSALTAHRKRLEGAERLRVGLPADFRPPETADSEEFAGILAAIAKARAHAVEVASRQTALAEGAAEIERALSDARAAYQRTVADASTSRRFALDRSLATIGPSLGACELTPPPVRAGDDFSALVSWCERLIAWSEEMRGTAVERRAEGAAEAEALDRALAEILAAHGVPTVGAFEERLAERTAAVAVAGERVRAARAKADRAARLDREIGTLEPVVNALEKLSRYLQNRAFKDFVMRRRERRLLGIGTEILRGMTGERYAFAEGFGILDRHADRVRSAKTLSGGETFLASLALALALVEVASRSGGKLDALFLDEGFGNLDAAALDDALAELADRAKSGKMIGIVTHVRGIAEQIDTILRVERRASGSVIERLEGPELAAFMEDEVRTGLLGAVQP